MQRIFIALSAV